MAAMGFSLNTLSLFGLVLSIGIVVDDAIVVVENVERWIKQGLSPREAAGKAMDEVTGPVIGVAAVLAAVFVPCGFIGGVTGLFFRQFALTIAVSTILSAVNSLTLSPALAAILLRPHGSPPDWFERLLDRLLGPFFRLFNRLFEAIAGGYATGVAALLGRSRLVMLVYLALMVLTWRTMAWYPQGFVPLQDQRYLIATVQLPDGAGVQRTAEVLDRIDRLVREVPGVTDTLRITMRISFAIYASMRLCLLHGPDHDDHDTKLKCVWRRRQVASANVGGGHIRQHLPLRRCLAIFRHCFVGLYPTVL
jgi:multidrug efflux pump subunit AcrB